MPKEETARELYERYKKNPLAGDVKFAAKGSHAAKLLQGQIDAVKATAKKSKGGRRTRRRGARKSRRGKGKGKSRRGGRSKKCKCSLL